MEIGCGPKIHEKLVDQNLKNALVDQKVKCLLAILVARKYRLRRRRLHVRSVDFVRAKISNLAILVALKYGLRRRLIHVRSGDFERE